MSTKTMTPTEAYDQAVQAVDQWQAELAAAREQLVKLEAAPVPDAASAKRQASALATAREYAHRCVVGVDTAIDARNAAAAAVVTAEAEDLAPEIDAARAELAAHDERTEQLRGPLEAHTGQSWRAVDPAAEWRVAGGDGVFRHKASTRARLASVLRSAERRRDALLAAARGEDPVHVCPEAELPESVKPGGILPSPSLLAHEAQAAEQAQADADLAEQLQGAQRRIDAAVEALGVDVDVKATDPVSPWSDQRGQRWRDRYGATHQAEIMADVDGHHARIAHLETIAALAGWDAGNEAAAAVAPASGPVTNNDATGEDQ